MKKRKNQSTYLTRLNMSDRSMRSPSRATNEPLHCGPPSSTVSQVTRSHRDPQALKSSKLSKDHKEALTAKLASIPDHLKPFLVRDVDLKDRKLTKQLLQAVIVYFKPDTVFKGRPNKPDLMITFDRDIRPIILPFSTKAVQPFGTSVTPAELKAALSPGFDPRLQSSRINILMAAIRHKNPLISISKGSKKDDIVALYEQYVHTQPTKLCKFISPPEINPQSKAYLDYTCDGLRFALQCHQPSLFIVGRASWPILQELYNRFVNSNCASPGDLAVSGIDYFWIRNVNHTG